LFRTGINDRAIEHGAGRPSGKPGNPASIFNQHDYAYKNKSVYARLKIGTDDLISCGTYDVLAGGVIPD
jgi:hypothetical protein